VSRPSNTRRGEEHRTVDPILEKAKSFSGDQEFERVLNQAKRLQDFAQGEMPEGFPYLFSLATIRMWSLMESAIDDLVVDVMRFCPQTRQLPVILKLKGPLVPFGSSSLDEQAEYLGNLLKEEVRASFQPGIGRFETILKAVDLGGPVHDEVRRAFLELSEIRHVLVHRRGKADAKLLDHCPWLPFKLGATVKVREAELDLFHQASLWYVIEIERRLALFQHETQPAEEAKIQAELEKRIVEIRAYLAGTMQR
jgi:hypothetical protein